MSNEINKIMLDGARQQIVALENAMSGQPGNTMIATMLEQQRTTVRNLEAQLGIAPTPAQPVASTQQQTMQAWGLTVEKRLEKLEELVQQAVPAVNDAAQAGVAIMSAIGQSMTPEQTAFVQARLTTSPQFFASQQARDAIAIFLDEWKTFEGAAS